MFPEVYRAEDMNELQMMQVMGYMDEHYPNRAWSMRPGNECIWVSVGVLSLYFIFRDGKIVDIQID